MDLGGMLLYIVVSAITPGPNNLTTFYLSASYGLRNCMKFITASMSCVLLKNLLIGFLNMALANVMPHILSWFKWLGAAYMLYLAYKMIKSGFSNDELGSGSAKEASYRTGIMLQVLNAKSWVGAMTIYAVYISADQFSALRVILVALLNTAFLTAATFIWGLFGGAIKNIYARYRKAFGIIMGLSLVYCAVTALL